MHVRDANASGHRSVLRIQSRMDGESMMSKRAVAGLFVAQMIAAVALAQDVTSSEFSRGYGGEIELLPKQSRSFSGSLGVTMSTSGLGLGGYEATLGGTILEDRLWFFATAQQHESRFVSD